MSQVILSSEWDSDATLVSNSFIDIFLKDANDAQVKIYLYLLRCNGSGMPLSISSIADFFNFTEKDVVRALKYWEKQKLIALFFDAGRHLTGIKLLPIAKRVETEEDYFSDIVIDEEKEDDIRRVSDKASVASKVFTLPKKPVFSAARLLEFKEQPDVSQLLFIAEQYLGRTLSANDVNSFLYMYDSLGFNADLIEYLIEYCVTNKKKSIYFIENTANNWAAAGVRDVEEAKVHTLNVPREVFEVFKAFGINCNRKPVEPEVNYVRCWMADFGFSMDVIAEACQRTIMKTHSPSFEYANTVLTNWASAGVKSLADIAAVDEEFRKKGKATQKTSMKADDRGSSEQTNASKKSGNRFNNFAQRSYDFTQLEKDILSN